jgi:hypothetical protein
MIGQSAEKLPIAAIFRAVFVQQIPDKFILWREIGL